jgi:glycosyltransferase involved in cell wall biosynthesis
MTDNMAVILLTFNSAGVIERTVAAARRVSSTLICVDSYSTDGTLQILERLGCEVHSRPFQNYAEQRNWAIQTLGSPYAWQLHLDADEVLDETAIDAIHQAVEDPGACVGFLLKRRTYFLGRPLRHGGAHSWHLRLFKSGAGACEDRLYDQHFICPGPTRRLAGWLHDMNVGSLTEWTARHNRWSDLEAQELLRPQAAGERLKGRLGVDPRARRRAYKGAYYQAPRYWRASLYFLFRYIIQLGFLDGRAGFLYAFFQALWFRMLVDAKLAEALAASALRKPEPPPRDATSQAAVATVRSVQNAGASSP